MSYEILYVDKVVKNDIPKISGVYKTRIKQAVENKLMTEPDLYGKPLRRSLKGYLKLRVGDYRIIFRIENKKVKIFAIAHRKMVYELISGRI
ncbi:MAG: type II toxin-antitoxin system RelE/ParE family toxin [Candidatus Parcubacteria bacterium]|nr:type II toxin-antitoxin system RelE/ParE family toxin [Candidatus Parcubacteria bacterium]